MESIGLKPIGYTRTRYNRTSIRTLPPLHWAAGKNTSAAILEVLLKAGANVHARDSKGGTRLHFAAIQGTTFAVFDSLLKAGADVHSKDSKERTPLDHPAVSPRVYYILLKAMRVNPLARWIQLARAWTTRLLR